MAIYIDQTESDGRWIIRTQGDVDLYTSPELRTAIMHAAKSQVRIGVDLRGVQYMDSSGVATLVEGLKASRDGDFQFTLIAPSNSVLKVLRLSRLDTLFEIQSVS